MYGNGSNISYHNQLNNNLQWQYGAKAKAHQSQLSKALTLAWRSWRSWRSIMAALAGVAIMAAGGQLAAYQLISANVSMAASMALNNGINRTISGIMAAKSNMYQAICVMASSA